MTATLRCRTFIAVFALSIACSNANRPTAPSQVPTPLTPTSPPPPIVQPLVVPPLSGPANNYVFSRQLEYPVSHFTLTSKYVLYENGAFSLQYVSPAGELVGAYLLDNGQISFRFSGGGDASGTLSGDVLEVRYSERMQHSDFENAVYKRSR
jgi:hypothetical protein